MSNTEGSPLVAAYSGSMPFLVPFINASGSACYANESGETLLHAAADGWQHRIIEFLILSGTIPNAQDNNGDTPLHKIVKSRELPCEGKFILESDPFEARTKTFSELLLRAADRSIRNKQGANPLHIAAWEGDVCAVKVLAGAKSLEDTTTRGATALALAVLNGHASCAEHLLLCGANHDFRFPSGGTILETIRESDDWGMRKLAE